MVLGSSGQAFLAGSDALTKIGFVDGLRCGFVLPLINEVESGLTGLKRCCMGPITVTAFEVGHFG